MQFVAIITINTTKKIIVIITKRKRALLNDSPRN